MKFPCRRQTFLCVSVLTFFFSHLKYPFLYCHPIILCSRIKKMTTFSATHHSLTGIFLHKKTASGTFLSYRIHFSVKQKRLRYRLWHQNQSRKKSHQNLRNESRTCLNQIHRLPEQKVPDCPNRMHLPHCVPVRFCKQLRRQDAESFLRFHPHSAPSPSEQS